MGQLFEAPIEPGMRVRVPFGRQKLVGIVMERADSSDLAEERLKPILEVLDPRPVLDASALALLRWAAEYYHHPIGEVLSTALPKALRLGAPSEAREERWAATAEGREAWASGEPRRAPRQREMLGYLVAAATGGGGVAVEEATAPARGGDVDDAGADTLAGAAVRASDGSMDDTGGRGGALGGNGSGDAHEHGDTVLRGGEAAGRSAGVSAQVLDDALPNWRDTAKVLLKRGWIASTEVVMGGGEAGFAVKTPGPDLLVEQ